VVIGIMRLRPPKLQRLPADLQTCFGAAIRQWGQAINRAINR
jgi:hypothetical protein